MFVSAQNTDLNTFIQEPKLYVRDNYGNYFNETVSTAPGFPGTYLQLLVVI